MSLNIPGVSVKGLDSESGVANQMPTSAEQGQIKSRLSLSKGNYYSVPVNYVVNGHLRFPELSIF